MLCYLLVFDSVYSSQMLIKKKKMLISTIPVKLNYQKSIIFKACFSSGNIFKCDTVVLIPLKVHRSCKPELFYENQICSQYLETKTISAFNHKYVATAKSSRGKNCYRW